MRLRITVNRDFIFPPTIINEVYSLSYNGCSDMDGMWMRDMWGTPPKMWEIMNIKGKIAIISNIYYRS